MIRLLLADDHPLVRHGVALTLAAEPDLEVVAEVGDGEQALHALITQDVDVAVLDVSMPRLTGVQVARRALEQRPGLKVVLLSMHDNDQYVREAERVGAVAYVLKSAAHTDLVAAIRAAVDGERFTVPHAGADDDHDALTPREEEVLKLIAEGLSGREIAEVLVIAEKTVERHRANVLEKLGLRDRVALTRYAIRRGLVEP